MGLDENEKVYSCNTDDTPSDDGLTGVDCTFKDVEAKDSIKSGESYSDYVYETDYGTVGGPEWDSTDAEKGRMDNNDNEYTDYQNIYYLCDFETGSQANDEMPAECGGPKIAKTKHTDDPDKLCYSHILNGLVSTAVILIGF